MFQPLLFLREMLLKFYEGVEFQLWIKKEIVSVDKIDKTCSMEWEKIATGINWDVNYTEMFNCELDLDLKLLLEDTRYGVSLHKTLKAESLELIYINIDYWSS